ncbi:MAG: GNAT family N-acetyltransferase [Myxococcales bacterium]|nr:GNAT family N-acetyltransferase [Myxococcales bacterium]
MSRAPTAPTITPGFAPAQREAAAALYWQAFGDKLGRLLGPPDRGRAVIARALDPAFALSAAAPDGRLLGVAGFKTAAGAFVDLDFADLRAAFGLTGALWRAPLLAIAERPIEAGRLLMDGICVDPDARGLGIGSALLDAIVAEARRRKLVEVRLDVIDRNTRARALYLRKGFRPVADNPIGPLRFVFGFRRSTTMVRAVGEGGQRVADAMAAAPPPRPAPDDGMRDGTR